MNPGLASFLAVLIAYLIGSISFAIVFSNLFGLRDPRTYGSRNPGATNVLRSGNKAAAILTLVFDALKGWLPVYLARTAAPSFGFGAETIALVALAAFVGHLFPIYHGWRGGKGVSTALGVLFGLRIELALVTIVCFLIVVVAFRWVSFAAIVAAAFAAFWTMLRWGTDATALAVLAMSVLVIWRHRANIARLLAGTESRIGLK